jgi:hypothetical protein
MTRVLDDEEAVMLEQLPRVDGTMAPLQASLADMIAWLEQANPQSDAEALRILRDAFAEVPLVTRVIACGEWKR